MTRQEPRERSSHARTAAAFFALSLLLGSTSAQSLAIERAEARFADKVYRFELVATLDAPVESVSAVLRDYERYPALDPRILESRVLERPEQGVVMLQTTLRMCFGPFCRNVKRIERVEEEGDALHAMADPMRSDVSSGETHTTLAAVEEEKTRVTYTTAIAPAFWIPAIVGRRWMLRTLREATVELFECVEQRAAETSAAGAAPSITNDEEPAPH